MFFSNLILKICVYLNEKRVELKTDMNITHNTSVKSHGNCQRCNGYLATIWYPAIFLVSGIRRNTDYYPAGYRIPNYAKKNAFQSQMYLF